MSEQPMLRVEGLAKAYDSGFKFGPADFSWTPGTTAAVLGPNGAGKSTVFQMITGNMDASDGLVLLGEQRLTPDKPELKRKIGYLPQHLPLPLWNTGRELLLYAARLHELPDPEASVAKTLATWDSTTYADRPMQLLSHGMRKRIGLGLALMHQPPIAILDEPFSGLDIYQIRALERTVQERSAAGLTTILSTHILPYATRLCAQAWTVQTGEMQQLSAWDSASAGDREQLAEAVFFADKAEVAP